MTDEKCPCSKLMEIRGKFYCINKYEINPIDIISFNSIDECCKDCYTYKLFKENTELKSKILGYESDVTDTEKHLTSMIFNIKKENAELKRILRKEDSNEKWTAEGSLVKELYDIIDGNIEEINKLKEKVFCKNKFEITLTKQKKNPS